MSRSNVHAPGGSPGSGPDATPAHRTLVSLLEMALGAAEPAHVALAQALVESGREELPAAGPELVAFVRAHMLGVLSDQIGPRLTMALVDDLVAQLDPSSAPRQDPSVPPSSMPRPVRRAPGPPTPVTAWPSRPGSAPRMKRRGVALVDGDRVGRAALARALLRAQWEVTAVESAAELTAAFDAGDVVDAAIIDAAHPASLAIVEALAHGRPDVVIVARSADAVRTRAVLAHLGVTRLDVRSRDAPPEELIEVLEKT